MTTTLITGVGELVTNDPALGDESPLGLLEDAALVLDGDRVAWVGAATDAGPADERFDAGGRAVVPGFVDSHAHLVFAGERSAEFAARMTGEAYSAGGIRTTVAATRAATDEALRANAARLVAEMLRQGITTVEIKSGYGLTVEDEARSLVIAGELTPEVTYLGAHVVPDGIGAAPTTSRWSPGRCSRPARRTLDGSTSSASAGPSTRTRHARCSLQRVDGRARCPGSTPTSWAPARACSWRSSWARLLPTTAPISTDADVDALASSDDGGHAAAREWSSPPGRRTRTPAGSSTRVPPWRWRPTATRARATRRRWPCASPSLCARCG